ncbi:MAG TPA: hypothetical protein DIT89_05755 [Planctomycetaceae bacterium]|nr:hypothetical protein [Planctomycetaceae bacterium]
MELLSGVLCLLPQVNRSLYSDRDLQIHQGQFGNCVCGCVAKQQRVQGLECYQAWCLRSDQRSGWVEI